MTRITNKDSGYYVGERRPFVANNLRGTVEGSFYIVRSYNWYVLYAYDLENGIWYENVEKHSVSTSRQKTQARPKGALMNEVTHTEIKEIIKRKEEMVFFK